MSLFRTMGFHDEELIANAYRHSNGDVTAAIDELLALQIRTPRL